MEQPPCFREVLEADKNNLLYRYTSKGYKELAGTSISSPDLDPSVLFIGSTISLLKGELLKTSDSIEPTVCVQDCFRSHNLAIYNTDQEIKYNSFFQQFGVILPFEDRDKVLADAIDTIMEHYGVEKANLLIKSSNEVEVIIPTNGASAHTEHNTEQPEYYLWEYGESQLQGKGLTMAVRSSAAQSFEDIGNIIIIFRDGNPVAIEWGFGLETMRSRVHALPKPIYSSPVAEVIYIHDDHSEKYADCLSACTELMKAGVPPGRSGAQAITRNYLRALNLLSLKANTPLSEVSRTIITLSGNDMIADRISDYIQTIRNAGGNLASLTLKSSRDSKK